ncbi:RcnB family protein [Paraburkholderia mimosarum]|uniref:RcnB family protein n=1 Tax=Paraburkholderia mimosarum TaxID=312026 RepID=UPI000487C717|nr:RcnB family protein [Paraburkholderia mimosarum]
MKSQLVLSVIAALVVAASSSAIAQDTQGTSGSDQSQGTGRQQVMPTMPHRDWHEGQQVPSKYRHYNFLMNGNDWKSYNLDAPKRGQQWLGVNGDYVLVNRSNWKIAKIVPGTE